MRKFIPGFLALWGVLFGVAVYILHETYSAVLIESLLDTIARTLGIERTALMTSLAPYILAGSIAGIVVYAAYRLGRLDEADRKSRPGSDKAAEPDARPHISPLSNEKRDLALIDAVWRVALGNWGERNYSKGGYVFFKSCSEIRQKAFDGKLPIWAKRSGSELYEPLPLRFLAQPTACGDGHDDSDSQ